MFWDTHMHSSFSGDSESTPVSMIEAAVSLGLDGVCFTDHLDYDYPKEPDLFLLDLSAYERAIPALQKQYEGRLPILHGIELGIQPHLAGKYEKLLQQHRFDFIIASTHVVNRMDPYYAQFYDGRSEEEAYREYFASVLADIHAFRDFDVYGHLDYVVRYGPNKNKNYSYEKFRDSIDEILKLLISLGKGIECNTAGLKYGLGQPNPCEDILKRYKSLGGEILTIGADAHKPEHIAYGFDRLGGLLKSCGFTHYTVFKNRKPHFYPLT